MAFAALLGVTVFALVPIHWLLMGLMVLLPLGFGGMLPPIAHLGSVDLQAADPVAAVLAGRLLFVAVQSGVDPDRARIAKFLLLYTAWNLVVTALQVANGEPHADQQVISLVRMLVLHVLFGLLILAPFYRERARTTMRFLMGVAILFGLSVPVQVAATKLGFGFGDYFQYHGGGGRYSGLIGDPNQAALYTAFPLYVCAVAFLVRGDRRALALTGVLLFSLILTGTRGPLLMVAAGLAILWLRFLGPARTALSVLGLTAALLCAAVWVEQMQVVLMRSQGAALEQGIAGRWAPLFRSWQLFLDQPLLGYGFAGHQFHAESIRSSGVAANLNGSYNQALELLVNGGIVNLALFAAMVWSLCRALGRRLDALRTSPAAEGSVEVLMARASLVYVASLTLLMQTDLWLLPGASVGYLAFLGGALALGDGLAHPAADREATEPAWAERGVTA